MSRPALNGIVLGHNAFFGVDHLSSSRGAERAAHFQDPARVLDVIREAYKHGACGMMMSTHERAAPIAEKIALDTELAANFAVYPLLPYAQKFVTRANEVGMINVILEMLSGASVSQKLSLIMKGGAAILSKDVNSVLSALIQIELKTFSKLHMPAVFLHDAFTDLALAFGLRDVFEFYIEELEKNYRSQGAFATKNLPHLLARFKEWNLPKPLVMTHFNKAGFHMNPGREACEKAAADFAVDILAMGSLASGYLKPDDAYNYLKGVSNIRGVVVGTSSTAHIEETFSAITRHIPSLSSPR